MCLGRHLIVEDGGQRDYDIEDAAYWDSFTRCRVADSGGAVYLSVRSAGVNPVVPVPGGRGSSRRKMVDWPRAWLP